MTRAVASRATAAPATVAPARPAPARRSLHPWSWWAWAIGAATVASLTRNPLLLALLAAAVSWVVVARRSDAPWARTLRAYLWLALIVIGIRMVFQVAVGGLRTGTVLFTLPSVQLPDWAAGISLGGPVTAEALWFTICDAGRLAVLLWCIGAANTLANPRRALRTLPRSLHRLATAVVIALSVAPQLIESTQRVRRARRLRGSVGSRGHALRSLVVPVLEDAIERSMLLAASMESRGFGRDVAPSRYRPDPWRRVDSLTVACGALAAAIAIWLRRTQFAAIWPPASPVTWPPLDTGMVLIAALVAAPAWFTPAPEADAA